MKFYIAGPMTGLPDYNREAFHTAAAQLRKMGHDVYNPAEIEQGEAPKWHICMRLALKQMLEADALLMLPGWSQSKGASIERELAEKLCFAIVEWDGPDPWRELGTPLGQCRVCGDSVLDYPATCDLMAARGWDFYAKCSDPGCVNNIPREHYPGKDLSSWVI